jgi:hypothetical protein
LKCTRVGLSSAPIADHEAHSEGTLSDPRTFRRPALPSEPAHKHKRSGVYVPVGAPAALRPADYLPEPSDTRALLGPHGPAIWRAGPAPPKGSMEDPSPAVHRPATGLQWPLVRCDGGGCFGGLIGQR